LDIFLAVISSEARNLMSLYKLKRYLASAVDRLYLEKYFEVITAAYLVFPNFLASASFHLALTAQHLTFHLAFLKRE
jgi:hypothetical protein